MTVEEFKKSCQEATQRIAKVERHKHSIDNLTLRNSTNSQFKDHTWIFCRYPGLPCTSRMSVLSNNKLVVACAEKKGCLHSLGVRTK